MRTDEEIIAEIEESSEESLDEDLINQMLSDTHDILQLFGIQNLNRSTAVAVKAAMVRGQVFAAMCAAEGYQMPAFVRERLEKDLPGISESVQRFIQRQQLPSN